MLRNLRNTIAFPPDFDMSRTHERNVISDLLQRRPERRPSAMEILSGKFLPTGSFTDLGISQSLLESPNSVNFIRLMDILFDHTRDQNLERVSGGDLPHSTNPLLLNFYSTRLSTAFETIKIQNTILSKIKKYVGFGWSLIYRVFKSHGGLKIQVPTIDPSLGSVWNLNTSTADKADLLSNSGRILTLPYDLRAGFAKFLASLNISGKKL